MTKGAAADSKLYYAVNKSTGTCDFEELCDQIADRSTASRGEKRPSSLYRCSPPSPAKEAAVHSPVEISQKHTPVPCASRQMAQM